MQPLQYQLQNIKMMLDKTKKFLKQHCGYHYIGQ